MNTRVKLAFAVLVVSTCSLGGCPVPGPVPNNAAPPAVTPTLVSVSWEGWPRQDGRLPGLIPASFVNGRFQALPAFEVHIFVSGPMLGTSFTVSWNGLSLPLLPDRNQQLQNHAGWFDFRLNDTATQWDIVVAPPDNAFADELCSFGGTGATVVIQNTSQNATTPTSGQLTVQLGPDVLVVQRTEVCSHNPPLVGCSGPPTCCDGRQCCGGPGNYTPCSK